MDCGENHFLRVWGLGFFGFFWSDFGLQYVYYSYITVMLIQIESQLQLQKNDK